MAPALRATDLDRSVKYYTTGLGMVVIGKLSNGPVTEVFLNFENKGPQPGLILFRDASPGKSPPVDHGNANGHIVMRIADVAGISARLKAAGYDSSDIRGDGNVKVVMAKDPDGYALEFVQVPRSDAKPGGAMN